MVALSVATTERRYRTTCHVVLVSQDQLIDAVTPARFDHAYRPVYATAEDAIARAALSRGHTVVVDRTNRTRVHRLRRLQIAREYDRPAVAVVMTNPLEFCRKRNAARVGSRRGSEERMNGMIAALDPLEPSEGFAAIFDGKATLDGIVAHLQSMDLSGAVQQ